MGRFRVETQDVKTGDFDFLLPPECVAAAPAARRDEARLLVLDRGDGSRKHAHFRDLLAHLPPRALLVLNDTRVMPARLRGRKPTGGAFEVLLTRRLEREPAAPGTFQELWIGMTRGLAPDQGHRALDVGGGVQVALLDRLPGGQMRLRATGPGGSLVNVLERIGEIPLPPYIEAARRRGAAAAVDVDDRVRYQTVYAEEPGAVAAPTAGLHFTPELLAAARAAGHEVAFVTLHVGPGTFRPVEGDDPAQHQMDAEWFRIPPATADAISLARAEGRRVVAVGTTVVRTLEAAARMNGGQVAAGDGETDLFIVPGARFHVITDLITNFHLPRSTLLMLVAAFAGREPVLEAYAEAVRLGYRFYSYGDAMLITGDRA
ncbi:MAG TPA: tRNA preQ1(34) S-adenosylmethionine ribosyltransferase-isomerase QueA [Polyangia bacterium]|nr:tRNA preQ1(34) S-adenosylmethionine ribosyltransferase-isomerase QueA [Polyangia bacterium]